MSEEQQSPEEQKVKKVAPGLVKSSGYSKPKNIVANKTLKTVEETLPVTEKSEKYSQYYETTLNETNWLPPQGELNITEEMMLPKKEEKKQEQNKTKIEPPKKFEKPKQKEDIVVTNTPDIKKNVSSEMEIAMQYAKEANEQKFKQKETSFEIPANAVVDTKPVQEKASNVFGAIKDMPIQTEADKTAENKETLVKEKPFMKIDKTEIRTSVNSDGEKVYMVGKNVYDAKKFSEYLQEVGGRILAADCKFIQIKEVAYTLQKDGSYRDAQGRVLSVDDMLALVNEK